MKKQEQYNIIDNCEDLILDLFIRIYDGKIDKSALIISGEPEEKHINEAWEKILDEFNLLSNEVEYKKTVSIYDRYILNRSKYTAIVICLDVLKYKRDQKCIDILNNYGYEFEFDSDNIESYKSDWENINASSKSVFVKYKDAEKEYLEFHRKISAEQKKQIKSINWTENLTALWSIHKIHIDKKTTTVAEYCALIKMANNKNK